MYALAPARIYTGEEILEAHAIIIDQHRIHHLCPTLHLPRDLPIYTVDQINIAPGFIDLQLNGCGGVMLNGSFTSKTLEIMQQTNLRSGCTSFLPTLITTSDTEIVCAVEAMQHYLATQHHQALGLHLEGPYISEQRPGIHDPHFIRPPDGQMIDYLCQQAAVIRKVTLAPEVTPLSVIQRLHQAGITVALGHSNATAQQARRAFTAGAHYVTHLFNAMAPLSSREPGLLGATLSAPEIYAGVIADGVHLAWSNLRIAQQLKREKLILVTHATAAAGSTLDHFLFAGQRVYCRSGQCRNEQGRLSGSTLTMMEAVKNCVHYAGIALEEALRMASLYPAQAIGLANQLGSIAPGKVANLVLFTNDYSVVATVLNGHYQFLEH